MRVTRCPQLAGRSVAIVVDDAADRHSLTQFAMAAGLRAASADDADLVFTNAARKDRGAIRVTSEVSYAERGAALSTNPLSWYAFVRACERALPQPEAAQAPSAPARPVVAAPASEALGAHILVAEDHPINRELIAKQLRLLGYRVTLAEDGVVALERLREGRFDALLTDCHMPRMDGFDLAQQIRQQEQPGGRRLPIVAITATTLAEEHARARAVGMDACLLKPTTLATLQEALSALWTNAPPPPGTAPDTTPADDNTFPLSLEDLRRTLGTGPAAASLAQVFLSSLDDDAERLRPLLDSLDRPALRKWAHRTSGALALLRSPSVDAEAEAFRQAIHSGTDSDVRTAGAQMVRLLAHIRQLLTALKTICESVVHRTQVADS